jgi:dTDP-glucose 4,6-dehydratase
VVEPEDVAGMEWKNAVSAAPKSFPIGLYSHPQPVLTGSTQFDPHPDVKNIMITGGAGFIASYLVRHLTLKYPSYRVISFDKMDYCATLNNTACLSPYPNFRFIYGDVTDIAKVMRCMREHAIDTIFHFAAQSHVDLSFGNSFEFTKTNVEGTHVMLEAAVKHKIKRFIHISTDEVNGEHTDGADLTENSLLKPTNPYAASKAAAEMYVNAYSMSFKLPVVIVRSNNVYGPHQYPEKIIPKFASLLERGRRLIIHGDGMHMRRYLYAGDAADAFDTILHRGGVGEIYNVGSRDEVSNQELAGLMLGLFGFEEGEGGREHIQYVKDRPFNDKRYAVDASKLRGLGWEQKTGFAEGLKLTVDWYRKFGKTWWGDVEGVLTPYPEVRESVIEDDLCNSRAMSAVDGQNLRVEKEANGALLSVPEIKANAGNARKRGRESLEGKENEDAGKGERGSCWVRI